MVGACAGGGLGLRGDRGDSCYGSRDPYVRVSSVLNWACLKLAEEMRSWDRVRNP